MWICTLYANIYTCRNIYTYTYTYKYQYIYIYVCLGMAKPGLAWNWRPTLGTRLGPQTWSPGGAQLG